MADRGQAYTLEAITASLLLIGGLVFALQATAVTPLSASTSSQHIENQQQAVAEGMFASAAEEGALRETLLYWNASNTSFYDTGNESYYVDTLMPTTLGQMISRSFTDRTIVVNVYARYRTSSDRMKRQRILYRGEPSDNAVSASATVTLYDDDELRNADGTPTGTTLSSTTDYFAPDAYPSSGVYNVVEMEVVAWRQ